MKFTYKFSPLSSTQQIDIAYVYLVEQLELLSQKLFSQKLPITTLKIFPHYLEEYDFIFDHVKTLGNPASFNSKTSYYSSTPRTINGHRIHSLGVRIVDPYRLHVGCGDYEIESFEEFKSKYLNTSPYIRQFSDKTDMIEIWHPDFDILGYILPKQ